MSSLDAKTPGWFRRSANLLTLSGCLYVAHAACIGSDMTGEFVAGPVVNDFFDEIGANDLHISLLSAVPRVMLLMFFAGALLANRLTRRKPTFLALFVPARLLYLLVAFIPLIFPNAPTEWVMGAIITTIAVHWALSNTGETLFQSWMADLIPHRILSRYVGGRNRWMSLTSLVALLIVSVFVHTSGWSVMIKFPILVSVGVALGLTDILLFLGIREPPHVPVRDRHPFHLLVEPVRHHEYRSFLAFLCSWRVALIIIWAFAFRYFDKVLGVPLGYVILLTGLQFVAHALVSKTWGRLADKHGYRPIFTVCVLLKPIFVLGLFALTPENALWLLIPMMTLEGILNAGVRVAVNGYSMKRAPRENRSMFLAAAAGLTGICSGLAAIGAGAFLGSLDGQAADWLGRTWNKYHLVFAISLAMQLGCVFLVRRVREAGRSRTREMLAELFAKTPEEPPISAP